jgi:hypothetical protein
MAQKSVDLVTAMQPAEALAAASSALEGSKFKCKPTGDYGFRAERGSAAKRALLGGFSDRSILDVSVFDNGGTLTIRIEMAGTGWSGGALGAQRASNAFDVAAREVAQAIGAAPPAV